MGKEEARKILTAAITRDLFEQGKAYAKAEDGENNLHGFHSLLPQWKTNGALETDMLREDD